MARFSVPETMPLALSAVMPAIGGAGVTRHASVGQRTYSKLVGAEDGLIRTTQSNMLAPAYLTVQALADTLFDVTEPALLTAAARQAREGMHALLLGWGRGQAAHRAGAAGGAAGLAPSGAQRINRLAADWLAYARVQRLHAAPVELLPLLCSLAHLVRQSLGARIDVSVHVAHDCPPCLVDRQALEEALFHLVANARAAMPMGGRLTFSAGSVRRSDGSARIELSVADSGSGMTPEVAAHAMEPFFTTRTHDPGAGMGLAAVEGFASQCGGGLALRSTPRGGTVVTLYLAEAAGGMAMTDARGDITP
jgi:signal transduction histidine kinase